MVGFRGYALIGAAGALLATSAMPALGAASALLKARDLAPVSLGELGSIASFTPAIGDSKLSSAYAHAILNRNGKSFRFTPTSGSLSGRRSITVLVRADGNSLNREDRGAQLGIAPLAFNLDSPRGWRKFAMPELVGRKPLDPVATDLSGVKNFALDSAKTSGDPARLKTNIHVEGIQDTGTSPRTLAGEKQYSVDAATSYSLTRNLNVTAGVRYAGPDNRLAPITDQRQDNQAVYVGTVFKF